MFALRGIAVSLTFFVLIYCSLSAIVAVAWRVLKCLHTTERRMADLLFALRVIPVIASAAITFAFVVPSFQLLEPRSAEEGMGGAMPIGLGLCALLLIAYGCLRVIAAQVTTARMVASWLERVRPMDAITPTLSFKSQHESPPLTLVGIRRPKVLVSELAVALLTGGELRIALKHELAHMQSHDNFKKLVFRFCPFPGMASLESAWSQTAELAADDAAISTLDEAIDLAAALVKLSRLIPVAAAPVCTVGFVTGSISARVARLLAWNEAKKGKDEPLLMRPLYAILPIFLALLCVVVTYGPALALTHEVTEWLVR